MFELRNIRFYQWLALIVKFRVVRKRGVAMANKKLQMGTQIPRGAYFSKVLRYSVTNSVIIIIHTEMK